MRGTVAKRLRRIAAEQTQGLPMKTFVPQKYRRYFMDEKGKQVESIRTTSVLGSCTRAVYRALKRGYKRNAAVA